MLQFALSECGRTGRRTDKKNIAHQASRPHTQITWPGPLQIAVELRAISLDARSPCAPSFLLPKSLSPLHCFLCCFYLVIVEIGKCAASARLMIRFFEPLDRR